jgi:hypothetical protein
MFDIDLCEAKRISLVSFHGELSAEDYVELDRLARDPGVAAGIHCIYDMTRVEVNRLVTDFVASRGALPQTFKGFERIYVVPQHDLKLLIRLYIAYQTAQGARPPILVDRLDEALAKFDAKRSEFRRFASWP